MQDSEGGKERKEVELHKLTFVCICTFNINIADCSSGSSGWQSRRCQTEDSDILFSSVYPRTCLDKTLVLLWLSCVYCCHLMCICCTMCVLLFFTLDAGLLARSQYSEGPATGHLDTGFSWFPCA